VWDKTKKHTFGLEATLQGTRIGHEAQERWSDLCQIKTLTDETSKSFGLKNDVSDMFK
jgi:hypothetical protein